MRVLKLAQSWTTMKVLLSIIISTLGALGNLTFILLIGKLNPFRHGSGAIRAKLTSIVISHYHLHPGDAGQPHLYSTHRQA
jgi:hypothetical protein